MSDDGCGSPIRSSFLDEFEAADLVLDTAIRDSLSSPAEVEVELAI